MTVRVRIAAVAILFAVGFMIPLFARAQTNDELQQQIINLLERLDTLQKQVGTGQDISAPADLPQGGATGGEVLAGGLTLARELERGMRGSDISALQSFLGRDASIYPGRQVTGFFGPLTEEAVKRFQVACGIIAAGDYQSTGYGRVGPKTRTALMVGCRGVPQGVVGGFMRVSPASGVAPLTATIAVTANLARSCEYSTYALDFGDGTQSAQIIVPAGRCAEFDQSVPHTYVRPGTYTVTLRAGTHYATTNVVVTGGTSGNTGTTQPPPVRQGSALPTFTYRGKTFALGSQEVSGPLELYEYPLLGQPVEQWTELMTFGRDKTLLGRATLQDLDGAAQQTVDIMRGNGAVVHRTFTHQDRRDPSKIYNVIIMAFQIPGYVELDIRKMFVRNGEIISITYGQKVALEGSVSAQQIISSFFAQSNIDGLSFVETEFYLPWLVTYTRPTDYGPPPNPSPAIVNPQLSITPSFEGDIRRIQVRFTLANSCAAYTLNWGDNSAPISRGQGSENCSAGTEVQTQTHTYPTTSSNVTYVVSLTYGPPGNQATQTASIVIVGY